MSLIPQDEMFELKAATAVMAVASGAELEQEQKAVLLTLEQHL